MHVWLTQFSELCSSAQAALFYFKCSKHALAWVTGLVMCDKRLVVGTFCVCTQPNHIVMGIFLCLSFFWIVTFSFTFFFVFVLLGCQDLFVRLCSFAKSSAFLDNYFGRTSDTLVTQACLTIVRANRFSLTVVTGFHTADETAIMLPTRVIAK